MSSESSERPRASAGVRPSASDLRDASDPLRGRIPEDDLALAIDRDDPVGDVGEDRLAPLLLVADLLVEVGVRARRGSRGRQRLQRLRLLLEPVTRALGIDGEDPLRGSVRPDDRHAEIGGIPRGQHRVDLSDARVGADVCDRACRARLHDVSDQPGGRGGSRAERLRLTGPCGGPHDDLVVLEHAHGGAVGLDERGCQPRALIEDRVRVELPCQLASRAGELLRE